MTKQEDELMTAGEAREYLGVGKQKMARLLVDGTLPSEPDPLDRRIRLVKRSDVEALASRSSKKVAA
jgi:excisionase family DNA binding protein